MILPFLLLGFAASTSHACTRQTAAPAAIEAVQARFDDYRGRCVRLRGVLASGNLYADRQATIDLVPPGREDPARSILVYPRGRPRTRPAEWVEIVGRIGSCADQNEVLRRWIDAHPDGGMWLISGYCHVSMENYVDPAAVRLLGREPVLRLTEAEVPAERRRLVDAPPSIAGRAENEAVARALAAAIASADEAAFLRYAHPETQSELDNLHGARPPRWLREDLAKAHSEFLAAVRSSPLRTLGALDGRQQRILVDPRELADPGGEPGYLFCWCREHDCTSRWPVDRRDADNDPSRPYACVGTSRYAISGKETVRATAQLRSGGFAEPAWPRPPQ